MEFNEKLQQIRKKNNLTQEQLAEKLFISRTAVSKWENGKGYPNIDSLKEISKILDVSIDELLSSEEIITLAENENNQNIRKIGSLIYGILDLIVLSFMFLPLFSQKEDEYFKSISLIEFSGASQWIIYISYFLLIITAIIGITSIIMQNKENNNFYKKLNIISMIVNSASIIFFIATRQLYVATFLFLFIMFKVVLLFKTTR